MKNKVLPILLLLLLICCPMRAVETILVGTVYDAGTGQVLPNVSVYFKGTKVGTTTNDEGVFYLHVNMEVKAKLVISAIGYKRQQYDIAPGMSAGIECLLEEKVSELATVVALPGENPAIALMDAVRAHRKENDKAASSNSASAANTASSAADGISSAERSSASSSAAETLSSAVSSSFRKTDRYFISNLQSRHLRRRIWKNMESGMVQLDDSSYLMPLPEKGFAKYMIPLPEHLDFYESNIPFLSTSFLSPLSASANTFYRFYLMDSSVVSYNGLREKHYRVHFLPKNAFNPTLSGVLEVDSATYALRRVNASIPREANINYLSALQYETTYGQDSRMTDEQMGALMDIAVKGDTSHIFPSLLALGLRSLPAAKQVPDTIVGQDSLISAFLATAEPTGTLPTIDDSLAAALQDSIAATPLFRVVEWLAYTAYTGYMPTGTPIEIGKITDIIGYTRQDGFHFGLPFRTNARMSKYVSLGGFVGYGLRDRGIKYKAEIQLRLPTERLHQFALSASDRYAYTEISAFEGLQHENNIAETNLRFTSYLLKDVYYNKATAYNSAARKREVRISAHDAWTESEGSRPAVETDLSQQFGRQGYGNPMAYHYYDMPSYKYASLRGVVRLGWGEQVADFYMIRRHLYSKYPTVFLGAEIGSYSFDDQSTGAMESASAYHMYGLLHAMVRQDIPLGPGGTLSYMAEAGVVLGKVPYPLLAIMNGNQGVTFSPERFTLMNNYQYAADKYIQLHLNWDGKGILFNQIPGIRYARFHELVEAKIAYGGLSNKHQSVIPYPEALSGTSSLQSLRVPYAEVGIGIGNILRLADVYSVWRLTNRSDLSSARWAIRFRIHLGL